MVFTQISNSLLGSRAGGLEPYQQSIRGSLVRGVRKGREMTENRYVASGTTEDIVPATRERGVKTHCRELYVCTKISQITLLSAGCLPRSSCHCQERTALFLQTENRAVGFNNLLGRFQGLKWLRGHVSDVLLCSLKPSHQLQCARLVPA